MTELDRITSDQDQRKDEGGFALISILAIIIPLALIVGASTSLMQGRNAGLLAQIRNEKAFLAAESGIDEALFQAQTGSIQSGIRIEADLGNGMSFTVMPLYLGADGADNDGDTLTDEPDEDVFRLMVVGKYQFAVKKIVAFLGRTASLPAIESAVMLAELGTGTETILEIDSTSSISGWEGGNPSIGTGKPGITIPIGSTTTATSRFEPGYAARVSGSPSALAEVGISFDLKAFVAAIKNSADVVVNGEWSGGSLGNAATNDFKIIYGSGEVEFENGFTGAGILVVEGELEMEHDSSFEGLVIVLGEMELEHSSNITGALIMAPGREHGESGDLKLELELEDGSSLNYSQAILNKLASIMPGGNWVAFNGWQELSRHATAGF